MEQKGVLITDRSSILPMTLNWKFSSAVLYKTMSGRQIRSAGIRTYEIPPNSAGTQFRL